MFKKTIVKKNSYYDSVTLMSLSNDIYKLDGVKEAVVSMGTEMNKDLLKNVDLATEESNNAGENDLIIALETEDEAVFEQTLAKLNEMLDKKDQKSEKKEFKAKTIKSALKKVEGANLAVISVPGKYAAREARIALENNLHVMLFSDNVPVSEEISLKKLAGEKGLLMMGPDCGTAAVNNKGICFANKVHKGRIGLAAASGTGLQEVMVQIERFGGGVSQALGTGGRDLKGDVSGLMMIDSLKALAEDPETEVITLISKPPAKKVEQKILKEIQKIDKDVVISFLEGDGESVEEAGAVFADNLRDAALKSVELAGYDFEDILSYRENSKLQQKIKEQAEKLTQEQIHLRGLFGGGTLCAESLMVLRDELGELKSNIAKKEAEKLADLNNYSGSVVLDMGEDQFTQGKPHPMIEPSLRNQRIIKEAEDSSVGVILLDFELGYGSHQDPVGETLEAIREAKAVAQIEEREIIFVAYICGTKLDEQDLEKQKKLLLAEDVLVAASNVEAAQMAADILNVRRGK